METLPTELLTQITSLLSNTDLAHLTTTNHLLQHRVTPLLFSRPDALGRALCWACSRGLLPLLQRLIPDYSTPSTVTVHWHREWLYKAHDNGPREYHGQATILTLYIAAARHQLDAFRLLLSLGARVDVPNLAPWVLPQFMKAICTPTATGNWDFLRLFYQENLHLQLQPKHHPSFTLPLLQVIQAKGQPEPPLETVQLILDHGGAQFIDEGQERYPRSYITPLTAAMLQHRDDYDTLPLLDLLLSQGASIHGRALERPVDRPRHIPIFVAVERLAQTGETALLDWCLSQGADLNQTVPMKLPYKRFHYHLGYSYTTPPLYYLHSINYNWKGPKRTPDEAVSGLCCLLDKGAHIDPPPRGPDERTRGHNNTLPYPCEPAPWSLEFLVATWGVVEIQHSPVYRAIVQYLLRHSAQTGKTRTTARFLARAEFSLETHHSLLRQRNRLYMPERDEEIQAWAGLVSTLLESAPDPPDKPKQDTELATELAKLELDPPEQPELNVTHLLAAYLALKAHRVERPFELGPVTVDLLLKAGAEVPSATTLQALNQLEHPDPDFLGRDWNWDDYIQGVLQYVLGR